MNSTPHWPIAAPPGLLKRLSNYDALLIDEIGYLTLRPEQVKRVF